MNQLYAGSFGSVGFTGRRGPTPILPPHQSVIRTTCVRRDFISGKPFSGRPSVIVSSKTPTIIDRLSACDRLAVARVASAEAPAANIKVISAIRMLRLDIDRFRLPLV